MHELGIIVHITKSLLEIAKENNLSEISSVTLEIGEVSGIVDHFLTDCWTYYRKKEDLIENSKLLIETIPAITYCQDCESQYETIKYGRECPNCNSGNTYLLVGNECNIKQIEAK